MGKKAEKQTKTPQPEDEKRERKKCAILEEKGLPALLPFRHQMLLSAMKKEIRYPILEKLKKLEKQ